VVPGWLSDAVLALALGLALVADLRERRIYNWITYPLLLAGLAFAAVDAWSDGRADPLVSAAGGALLASALFFVGALFGQMGFGDAKLMAGVGAMLRLPQAAGALLFVTVAGGALGAVAALARTPAGRRLSERLGVRGTREPGFGGSVHYGVAVALGTVAFRLWARLPAEPPDLP
jgi:prepilin peptidase CpaA